MAMVTDWSNDKAISAREALVQVGAVGLVGLGVTGVHLVTGLGVPCPFRALTGWLCPLCGGTHMAEALLRGDVPAAWLANPLALIVSALIGIRSAGLVVELVRNPTAPARRWLPAPWRRHAFATIVVVSIAYVLVRNLLPLG